MRVGLGFDAHRFDPDRELVLGGVRVADSPGLAGHSDGDALAHAVADALLGAAGLGDLGEHFPANDRWRGASGASILEEVIVKLRNAGLRVRNVDATVVAQTPRLEPHRGAMVDKLAAAMSVASSAVSVKATTTDEMGSIGRAEGIAALAVASVEPL